MSDPSGEARFERRRALGAGGMGVVHVAFDRERGAEVALKTLTRLDPSSLAALKNEFRALAELTHENLVALHELVSEGGAWFLSMEIIDGVTFLEHVRAGAEQPRRQADLSTVELAATLAIPTTLRSASWPEGGAGSASSTSSTSFTMSTSSPRQLGAPACRLEVLRPALRQLALGVAVIHAAGQVHRDLKPSNVLVTKAGRVVILDFGLAMVQRGRRVEPAAGPRLIVGTPEYMAPEQASGEPAGPASDCYAVGMMLFEALTGQLPFAGDTRQILLAKRWSEPRSPTELAAGIPEDLAQLCVDCLVRAPEKRPTASEIVRRLDGAPPRIFLPDLLAPPSSQPSSSPGDREAFVSPPVPSSSRTSLGAGVFLGRENELRALHEAFAASRRGRPVTAYVSGPSGMGKSALVEHFLDGLWQSDAAVVLSGRCYERESVPYKAWDSLIDALGSWLSARSPDEAAELLPRDADELGRVFPVLFGVEGIAEATMRRDPSSSRIEERRRAFGALKELLRRIARRRPLVLHLDDLQWGDVDSARLLVSLLAPPDPPPLLLVGSFRSEEEQASPFFGELRGPDASTQDLGEIRAVNVGPLAREDAVSLALALLDPRGASRASPALAAVVAAESLGSPLFVAELVATALRGGVNLARAGVVSDDAGASLSTVALAGVSLDGLILERVAGLSIEARRLLEIYAVAARPLAQGIAAAAADLDVRDPAAHRALRSARLVRSQGAKALDLAEVYHDRIREAVVGGMDPVRLQEIHRALAVALEASGQADPEVLAVHLEGAGDLARAGYFAALAADRAAGALAFERAARLYRLALGWKIKGDVAATRALQIKLGDALVNAGLGAEAAPVLLAAAEGASSSEALELRRRAAEQLLGSGHIDRGVRVLRDVLASVDVDYPETSTGATMTLLARLGRLRLRGTRFEERPIEAISPAALARIDACYAAGKGLTLVDPARGLGFLAQHLTLALEAGDPRRVSLGLAFHGISLCTQGASGYARARRALDEARAIAERLRDPYLLGVAGSCSAAAEMCLGRWKATVALADQANTVLRTRCSGVAWEIEGGIVCSEVSLLWMGRLAELAEFVRTHVHEALERGDLFAATYARMHTWYAPIAADDVSGASAEMRDALGRWSRGGFHIMHFWALYAEVQYELYAGRAPAAWACLEKAWPALEKSNILRVQFHRIFMTLLRGSVAVAAALTGLLRDRSRLLKEAERAAARLTSEATQVARPAAALLSASILAARGRSSEARGPLELASVEFDAADMALHAEVARRRLGELVGGETGRGMIARADALMGAQGIKRPELWTGIHAPGF
jgi:eukaryotic-like serine/threonine-protein kinase